MPRLGWARAAESGRRVLIRVERPLDLDSPAQLVASVLSKKSRRRHARVVDLPVGPTAKIRGYAEAERLWRRLRRRGRRHRDAGLPSSRGAQPIGRGIGPALEARDALAVLRSEPEAPVDLRERSLQLAGHLLEMALAAQPGSGEGMARAILDDGRAWKKFQAIAEAQGGMRVPADGPVQADRTRLGGPDGIVKEIDNRRLGVAKVAKLAGAPDDPAGVLRARPWLSGSVSSGDPVYTIHAAAPGELDYALAYAGRPRISSDWRRSDAAHGPTLPGNDALAARLTPSLGARRGRFDVRASPMAKRTCGWEGRSPVGRS